MNLPSKQLSTSSSTSGNASSTSTSTDSRMLFKIPSLPPIQKKGTVKETSGPPPSLSWQHPLLSLCKPFYTTALTPSPLPLPLIARFDPLCSRAMITEITLKTHYPTFEKKIRKPTTEGMTLRGKDEGFTNFDYSFVEDLPLGFVGVDGDKVEVLVEKCVVNKNVMLEGVFVLGVEFWGGGNKKVEFDRKKGELRVGGRMVALRGCE